MQAIRMGKIYRNKEDQQFMVKRLESRKVKFLFFFTRLVDVVIYYSASSQEHVTPLKEFYQQFTLDPLPHGGIFHLLEKGEKILLPQRPFHFGHDLAKPGNDKTITVTINPDDIPDGIVEKIRKKFEASYVGPRSESNCEVIFSDEEKQEIKELHARLNNGE